ncbi:serine/threonine protein kinase [Undibacterium flavidum]|uniref:Stress response kinase A n=1 Tax=Undibacterium flavidum TaxID=2762297 RepID=A0ABR6YE82_9BURK|nr:serine/threonine protein kinase [Undibacterium flavidum]MBC3874875.1 serine/threonine protein kinase [Undibacterium flavidum]
MSSNILIPGDHLPENYIENQSEDDSDRQSNPVDFSNLSPDCVFDAMHAQGFHCDGRLLALNSYENRVYQLGMDDASPLVVKFYRPLRWSDAQIKEEHQFVTELEAAEIPVVPALLDANGNSLREFSGFRFAVFARQGGRAPELDRAGTLEWIGRFLGRIHAVGARESYQHRPKINQQTYGDASLEYLLQHDFIPSDILNAYEATARMMLDAVRNAYQQAGEVQSLRLHGDCHMGNVLWTEVGAHLGAHTGPHFVDFDDSRMGPAMQDLWMLLSGSRQEMQAQLCDILMGYEDFHSFNPAELHLIEALRSLRLLHYSAWLAQRWGDPAFKQAFPWFNTQRYWQDRILEMREQIALMDEAPLRV